MSELDKFYRELKDEVNLSVLSEEEGGNLEQKFTEYSLSLLAESGETEDYLICYDEKVSRRGTEHKVNGYALSENYETLDLFITILYPNDDIQNVPKADADKAFDRLAKFFRNAIYQDYVNEIEESSEIFDLAQTLANVNEVKEFLTRVNLFLITNGKVNSEPKQLEKVAGYNTFSRVVDINYLFNLTQETGVPIEIDFNEMGVEIPCVSNKTANQDYTSFLGIIPGAALAEIYEKYGSRLLEQNVRSFLQFTGKINKGIRKTILEEPHMFLAFNNGIAATAEEVKLSKLSDGGRSIGYVKDFQIVNGGQTTASIYHTLKKSRSDIGEIFVPIKLTIIKNRENFAETVGRIAEYANTQNRVSASDLSSNKENHVILEKLSRTIWASPKEGETHQTRWFYERSRGQYRNEKSRFGLTPSKARQFEKQNPRAQVITKELLAKYINSWGEVWHGKRLVIGPHFVVRGSQKNYAQYLNYNFNIKPDSIYFQDAMALAILFKQAEKIYGIGHNALGDMRYIAVPYAISYLGFLCDYKLNLDTIWKRQGLSVNIRMVLRDLLVLVEQFIKNKAPGSLYGEWAKKEECWNALKESGTATPNIVPKDELWDENQVRRKLTEEEIEDALLKSKIGLIDAVPTDKWREISQLGPDVIELSSTMRSRALNIFSMKNRNAELPKNRVSDAIEIIDIVVRHVPDFFNTDETTKSINMKSHDSAFQPSGYQLNEELLRKVVEWDSHAKVLSRGELQYISDFAYGLKKLNSFHEANVKRHLETLIRAGFQF